MAKPESDFPTIEDARAVFQSLADEGFGELPVQVVIVPASTLAVLARNAGHTATEPARMIEIVRDGKELGVLITSVETLSIGRVQ